MKSRIRYCAGLAAGTVLLCSSVSAQPRAADAPWTIEDNLLIQRLPESMDRVWGEPQFSESPRKDAVAFIVLKPDPVTDLTLATLRVYSTEGLRKFADNRGPAPAPVFQTSVPSLDVRPGIGTLRWSADGSVLFYVSRASGAGQVMMWRQGEREARIVGDIEGDIDGMELVGESGLLAFGRPAMSAPVTDSNRPYTPAVVTGRSLPWILSNYQWPDLARPHRVFGIDWKRGGRAREYGVAAMTPPLGPISVSPDGRRVAFTEPMAAEWNGKCWWTTDSHAYPDRMVKMEGVQLAIVDLDSGAVSRPLAAPLGSWVMLTEVPAPALVWAPDGKSALVPFTFAPDDECQHRLGDERRSPAAYVVTFDGRSPQRVRTYDFNEVGEMTRTPRHAEWLGSGERVAITTAPVRIAIFRKGPPASERAQRVEFERGAQGWRQVGEPVEDAARSGEELFPRVPYSLLTVKEDYNLPPAIYARTGKGRERMLYDLAPHARNRKLGSVEIVHWKDSEGREWDGLLALPPGHRDGDRHPLIVQTHDYQKDRFFAEGPGTTAYPGRAALARGFAVLTVRENREAVNDSRAREAARMLNGYAAAVKAMGARGVADVEKAGVIGWSHTSYLVKYVISHAPDLFKAAVGVDGVDYSYGQYLVTLDWAESSFPEQYNAAYGGPPWSSWSSWLAEVPGFNVGRVRAPFRAEANSGVAQALWEWEFYAGLRRQYKPAELVVYPQGEHELVRPLERRVSTEGSLDWLDYWINGRRDESPAKQEQYRRWDRMREAQRIAESMAAPAAGAN